MYSITQRFIGLPQERQALIEHVLRKQGCDASWLPLWPRAAGLMDLPLAHGQESLWFMCHLADNAVYNISSALRLRGRLDRAALERAIGELIRRHEILRTRFPATAGRPVQEVLPVRPFALPRVVCSDRPGSERWEYALKLANEESVRPFDLAGSPPWRLCLYELGEEDHLLLTVFHHILWDGWSTGVWSRELAALYQAFSLGQPSPLPEPTLQFADYALFQREWLSGERLETLVAYWKRQLQDLPPLDLPTDRPRPSTPTFAGAEEPLALSPELTVALEDYSRQTGATLFMPLLAAFQALLHRYTGQERIAVGTPVANRQRREIEGLLGCFANITVMATGLSGDPTFSELLTRVREVTTGAYAHQDIPFELLVHKLQVERDASRNPLFQVMFALHSEQVEGLSLSGLQVESAPLEARYSHFDLGLHLWRTPEGLRGCISYNKDLFDAPTLRRMGAHYRRLLAAALREPERKLSSLPLLEEEEWRELRAWSQPAPLDAEPPALLARLETHAATSPEQAALLWQEDGQARRLTFGALWERTTRLARYLRHQRPGRVGLYLGTGPDEVVASLAALEAGVPFVSLELEGCSSAEVGLILTHRALAPRLATSGLALLCLDEPLPLRREEPLLEVPSEELACLSYTSGRPRRVTRLDLRQRLARLDSRLPLSPGEHVLTTAPTGRDFFVLERLWPLCNGATLVLGHVGEEGLSSPSQEPRPPDVAHFTSGQLAALLRPGHEEHLARLGTPRLVLCSGTLPRLELAEAFSRRWPSSRLVYLYTPPELATEVALLPLAPRGPHETTPAVKPDLLPTWVLDRYGQPTPVGVPGLVHVGTSPRAGTSAPEVPEDVVATADRGTWLADGTLHLLGSAPGTVWHEGLRLHLVEVEALLSRHPAVEVAHVLPRSSGGRQELVAYVVPCAAVTRQQLDSHVRPLLATPDLPLSLVLVSSLPLTPQGHFDEQALAALPVLDDALVTAWERKLAEAPGVTRVKVLAHEQTGPRTLLHLSRLLPELRANSAVERHTTTASGLLKQGDSAPSRPAHARGAPLILPEDAPRTLTEALLRTAETWRDRGMTFLQDTGAPTFLSYPDLLHRARCILTGLRARGLVPGSRVILQVEELREHFCAFWGCLLGGFIPVTVATAATYDRPSAVLGKLRNVWELLGHPPLIASRRLVEPLGATFQALPIDELAAHPPASGFHTARPEEVAFLQLSSGSTGLPKCIQETHQSVVHHVHGVQQHNGYTSEDVDLNWLPVDHVVSLITCHLKDTYLGITQVHVRPELILAEPLLWFDLLEKYRVTHSIAPNFAYKLVNDALARASSRRWELTSIKRLINAAEQVTLPVVEEFLRRTAPFGLEPRVLQPAFGMAEVCTGITYANDWTPRSGTLRVRKSSLQSVLEEAAPEEDALTFVDLGPVRPGLEVRIAGPDGQVLPECVIGIVQIRGSSVTPGYLLNDEANREAFVGEGWFSSGDLGFLRHGRLTITGRQKEMLNIRGANLYCYELEEAVSNVEGVEPTFVACCAVEDASTGSEALIIFFVPRQPGVDVALLRAIHEKVTAGFGVSPACVLPLARADFPKTTSGKIQRLQLKQELLAGRFDELRERLDLALENENTVPAWFHRPVWQRQEVSRASAHSLHDFSLVLCDASGLGQRLCARLGEWAIRVEPGTSFARVAPRAYTLDPREATHYDALLTALADDGLWPRRVFHLWTYGAPGAAPESAPQLLAAQEAASGGLLLLAQALARSPRGSRPSRLLVAASHTRAGAPGEHIASERASLRGLVKTLPQEWPTLSCRHIDLPPDELEANVERLLEEAAAETKDREILYREGARHVLRLAAVKPEPTAELPWKRGDLVLLSGGLGGVGIELARHLVTTQGLRLLLVGRTPLAGDETAVEPADALAPQRSAAERLQVLRELEQSGAVLYEVADVAELPGMQRAVSRAEYHFGATLAGAIHLAGLFPTRLLAEETPESLTRTVSPKLAGAWVLRQLVGEQGFLITFGSAYGLFGGVAVGAYTAAACALEAFVEEERRQGLARRYHFAFTHWEELGMSQGYRLTEQSLSRGYGMIGRKRGLCSLLAGLRNEPADWVVGLDAHKPNVRRYLRAPSNATERLRAWVAPATVSLPAWLQTAPLVDRFDTPAPCECTLVADLPLTASGEVDVTTLAGLARGQTPTAAERILPRTSLEKSIAGIWREVLQVDTIDVNTSFFALGGQSVLLVQVLNKLRSLLGRELSVVELFRQPTVALLARHLEQAETLPQQARQKVEERARKQREATRQRIMIRGRPGPGDKKNP
jgi:acyl-CoA synthetase (AMP-forming)/AMP-acid ligase II